MLYHHTWRASHWGLPGSTSTWQYPSSPTTTWHPPLLDPRDLLLVDALPPKPYITGTRMTSTRWSPSSICCDALRLHPNPLLIRFPTPTYHISTITSQHNQWPPIIIIIIIITIIIIIIINIITVIIITIITIITTSSIICVYLCIYLCTSSANYLTIHPSTSQSINLSIYLIIKQFIHSSIYLSIYLSIFLQYLSINLSVCHPINFVLFKGHNFLFDTDSFLSPYYPHSLLMCASWSG